MELSELQAKWDSLRKMKEEISEQLAMVARDIFKIEAKNKSAAASVKMFPIVRDFNVIIGEHVVLDDLPMLFSNKEKVKWLFTPDIWSILVESGAFESKSQARKNWQGIKEIPSGWTEIGPIGKQKLMIFIWNPSE